MKFFLQNNLLKSSHKLFLSLFILHSTWTRTNSSKPSFNYLNSAQPHQQNYKTCIYEDHLVTEKNWYGFLANVTLRSTGSLTFDFVFPARLCCKNILFYNEEQLSVLNSRMTCWQKESLVRPEEDQILRLTPKFSWSGCHVAKVDGVDSYVCKAGKSFNIPQKTTWYIAVSNCDTIFGLDLKYRIEVIGLYGECENPVLSSYPSLVDHIPYIGTSQVMHHVMSQPPKVNPSILVEEATQVDDVTSSDFKQTGSDVDATCHIDGILNVTDVNWFGFLGNFTIRGGGVLKFSFSYPYHMKMQHVLLYYEEDLPRLMRLGGCWDKFGMIHSHQAVEQIIELGERAAWNGCALTGGDPQQAVPPFILQTSTWPGHAWFGPNLTCRGQQTFRKSRTIYVAVSNCRSTIGLLLDYRIDVSRFESSQDRLDSCSFAPTHLAKTTIVLVLILSHLLSHHLERHFT